MISQLEVLVICGIGAAVIVVTLVALRALRLRRVGRAQPTSRSPAWVVAAFVGIGLGAAVVGSFLLKK